MKMSEISENESSIHSHFGETVTLSEAAAQWILLFPGLCEFSPENMELLKPKFQNVTSLNPANKCFKCGNQLSFIISSLCIFEYYNYKSFEKLFMSILMMKLFIVRQK